MSLQVVRMYSKTEKIETTYDGMFGGNPDYARTYIPGMTSYFAVYNDGSEVETSRDHYYAWMSRANA